MTHNEAGAKMFTSFYRTPDDINNFKIRVKIKEIQDGTLFQTTETKNNLESVESGEAKVFLWQQKNYGKHEREFYRDEKNCVTDLEKKYHLDVVKLVQNDDILFTYTNDDEVNLLEENIVTDSKITTNLCKDLKNLQLQKEEHRQVEDKSKEYDFFSSLTSSSSNCFLNDNFEVMYIMADLGEYVDRTYVRSEHILCTLKYNNERQVLHIFPDFSSSDPYVLQIDTNTRRHFQYYIEDASGKMPTDILLKENEILNKIALHQAKIRSQKIQADFEIPHKNTLRVFLFFEILRASGFEYNGIYVQYLIDLPSNWTCRHLEGLSGTTPTCFSESDDRAVNFGYLFEVVLEYNVQELKQTGIPKAPCVYFEVISKDSWSRYRTEGVAYTILPISQPGQCEYKLNCLRLQPQGPISNLRRFFIGDYSNYNDITWFSVPKHHEAKFINKYGVNTVGTGQLDVKISVIHQSEALVDEKGYNKLLNRENFILGKLNSSSLMKSVEEVVNAFKKAKHNMIEAKKNV